ncbi:hypothetical protein [Caldanaerobacter subterraneus]|uniref:Uncharacterized protein n=1 Tax=Caldanaerobacter subterraneus TaxID=911092 RepID=A0A7Y2PL78_9THEO|nr:hypothetical protein [Caldanaerobacter subterraneus]NNG66430.1 hypothetical protein [Caldanaerobacter subterraneus]
MKLRDKEKLNDRKTIKKIRRISDIKSFIELSAFGLIVVPLIGMAKATGFLFYLVGQVVRFYILALWYFFITKQYIIFLVSISSKYKPLYVNLIGIISFIGLLLFGYTLAYVVITITVGKIFFELGYTIEKLPEIFVMYKNLLHNRKAYSTRYQRVLAIPFAKLPQNLYDLDLSKDGDYSVSGNLVAMKFEGPQVRLTLENFGIYRDIMAFLNHLPEKSQIMLKQSTDYITYPVTLKIKVKDRVIRDINLDFYDYWFEHPHDPEIRLIHRLDPRQIERAKT